MKNIFDFFQPIHQFDSCLRILIIHMDVCPLGPRLQVELHLINLTNLSINNMWYYSLKFGRDILVRSYDFIRLALIYGNTIGHYLPKIEMVGENNNHNIFNLIAIHNIYNGGTLLMTWICILIHTLIIESDCFVVFVANALMIVVKGKLIDARFHSNTLSTRWNQCFQGGFFLKITISSVWSLCVPIY